MSEIKNLVKKYDIPDKIYKWNSDGELKKNKCSGKKNNKEYFANNHK